MVKIIGANFREGGKIYYFDPAELSLSAGDYIIVETSRGKEVAQVILGERMVEESQIVPPLRRVVRKAGTEDIEKMEANRRKEAEAYAVCQEKIEAHGLEMKLISVEYGFDNNKILFYFTADGRVDFRELVKDLASVFRTRIELRQIGVRDETKMLGGLGICGRELCCKSWLTDFVPVSIRMAKEQNLSLNPTKISGNCGRLMCCLKHEEETYEYLNARLPAVGDFVLNRQDETRGKVYSVDVLRQKVKVIVSLPGDDLEVREYPVEELSFRPRRKKGEQINREDLTEEQLALEEELSRAKGEYAEAAAAAVKQQEKQQQERQERRAKAGAQAAAVQEDKNRASAHRMTGKPVRAERVERGERADRAEKSDRGERNERAEKPDRGDRADRSERSERQAHAAGQERQARGGRNERQEKRDRDARSEKGVRTERQGKPEKASEGEGAPEEKRRRSRHRRYHRGGSHAGEQPAQSPDAKTPHPGA